MTVGERAFVRRALLIALVVVLVAAVLWVAYLLRNVLFMLFVSLFVAVAFEPPVHYLEKRGWRRGAATAVVFVVALVVLGLFFWALVPLFVEQFQQLVESIPGLIESLIVFARDNLGIDTSELDPQSIGRDLLASLQDLGGLVAGGLLGLATTVFGAVFFATTVALFSFYMIAELPQLQRTVLSLMPEVQQRHVLRVWDVAVEKMGGYVYSRLILAVIAGLLTIGVLGLLDVPFAISLGIWVGVLSQFIPVVGTYLAAILPALVALSFRGPLTALWVVLFLIAYQQVENYLISPRITRRTMEIHPAVSVGAIIVGGTLLGGIGVVLALPVAGIVQAMIGEWRRSYAVILDDQAENPSQA